MAEWIFAGRRDRYDIEDEFNALQLELCEVADVAFSVRGRNRFSFSRLFLTVAAEGEERSVLVNHTAGERFEMEPGNFYFLPSGIDFEFDFRPTTRFLSFHFHLRRHGREVFEGARHSLTGRSHAVGRLLELMRVEHLSLRGQWEFRSLLLGELAACLPEKEPANNTEPERYSRYAKLLRFLREEAHGALSIEELAAVAGMPPDRLSREFSRDFALPLKRFLAQSVAARAAALLRDPACKVREVAKALKFRDEYYFSRFFKHETGASPGEYRKTVVRDR